MFENTVQKYFSDNIKAGVEAEAGKNSQSAAEYFRREISESPRNPLGYLFYACCIYPWAGIDKTAQTISIGSEIDESILYYWRNEKFPAALRSRSHFASKLIRHHLSIQHEYAVKNSTERLINSVWTRTHNKKFSFFNKDQQPQLFMIPDLAARPWHNCENLHWTKYWTKNIDKIQEEILYQLPKISNQSRPYLQSNAKIETEIGKLYNSENWSAIHIYKNGFATEALEMFPELNKALSLTPTYGLTHNPQEVFISKLSALTSIPPHFGLSNHSLTVHIPISIPDRECKLTVNREEKSWSDHNILIFDDTYCHSASNPSNLDRIVLIFSIWHPDLSNQERIDISEAFWTRENWNLQRKLPSI